MLRNHFFMIFRGGRGVCPPSGFAHKLVGMKKTTTFSVNSSLQSPTQTCHIKLFSLYKCPTVLSNDGLQPELLLKIPSGRIKLGCTVCVLNVMQEAKMSMCIQHC